MDVRIRILTVGGALAILLLVIDLVRRRKLKEEYSVLWVGIGVVGLIFAIWYSLLDAVTNAIGAQTPASTLFFFGLLFCLVLLLHFSVRISALERRLTTLVQEVGLMSVEDPHGPVPVLAPAEARGGDAVPEPAVQAGTAVDA